MAIEQWAEEMRTIAEGDEEPEAAPIRVDWKRVVTPDGRTIDYQVVAGSHGLRGRRLLVVELDTEAAGRIEAAIAMLAGRADCRPQHTHVSCSGSATGDRAAPSRPEARRLTPPPRRIADVLDAIPAS